MKNKAPLALMEQLVMLLVFALAAGLCLQVFVLSDRMSRRNEARDYGVLAVQNTAEMMKICQGDLEECAKLLGGTACADGLQIGYDKQWDPVPPEQAEYCVRVTVVEDSVGLLGTGEVSAQTADGEHLFGVTVSWQEVADE